MKYKILRGHLDVQESEWRQTGHILTGELIARHKDTESKIYHLYKITLQVNLDSEGCFTYDVAEVKEGTRCIECGRLCKTDWARSNICRDCEELKCLEPLHEELSLQVSEVESKKSDLNAAT